jgi:hypothetical protein
MMRDVRHLTSEERISIKDMIDRAGFGEVLLVWEGVLRQDCDEQTREAAAPLLRKLRKLVTKDERIV